MATTSTTVPTGITLNDSKLFRQSCYVDGAWINAQSGAHHRRGQPGDRRGGRHGAEAWRSETRAAIEAADRALPGVAEEDREGARGSRQEAGTS